MALTDTTDSSWMELPLCWCVCPFVKFFAFFSSFFLFFLHREGGKEGKTFPRLRPRSYEVNAAKRLNYRKNVVNSSGRVVSRRTLFAPFPQLQCLAALSTRFRVYFFCVFFFLGPFDNPENRTEVCMTKPRRLNHTFPPTLSRRGLLLLLPFHSRSLSQPSDAHQQALGKHEKGWEGATSNSDEYNVTRQPNGHKKCDIIKAGRETNDREHLWCFVRDGNDWFASRLDMPSAALTTDHQSYAINLRRCRRFANFVSPLYGIIFRDKKQFQISATMCESRAGACVLPLRQKWCEWGTRGEGEKIDIRFKVVVPLVLFGKVERDDWKRFSFWYHANPWWASPFPFPTHFKCILTDFLSVAVLNCTFCVDLIAFEWASMPSYHCTSFAKGSCDCFETIWKF